MKAFISSHFGYYLLVWMCRRKKLTNKINNLHESGLRLILGKSVVSSDHKNLQILFMFKVQHKIAVKL